MNRPLAAAGLAVGLAFATPLAFAGEPVLEPGARGVVRTVMQGETIEEIPLRFIGTFEDFAGPGYDLHLVQLEGPVADHVGVASGMSGSPVYIDGRLIGALSYRMGAFPKDAIAGVTPIADILDARRARGSSSASDPSATRIATPVIAGGLTAEVRAWLAPALEPMGFVLTPGSSSVSSAGASDGSRKLAQGTGFAPGSPIGVGLVRGDITLAATGTVTHVDGDLVYAFGHPFFGSGEVEMPMHNARVLHVLADMLGSSKIAVVGPEAGTIVEDRLTAVVGKMGQQAAMIPLDLSVRGAGYGEDAFHFEIVRNSNLAPSMAGAVVANSLIGNPGYGQEATVFARGKIRLRGHPDLPVEMAFAGDGGGKHSLAVASRLSQLLQGLRHNPWAEIHVESIDLEIDVEPDIRQYEVEKLIYDRGPVTPGQSLTVTVVLRPRRGETIRRDVVLRVPGDLTESSRLMLAVGPPAEIERALGRPLQSRIETSPDIGAVLRALSEQRSEHRLTAVLYERTSGLVSGGRTLSDLPFSARHLLSRNTAATKQMLVAPLDRTEVALEGPLTGGGLAVRLVVRQDNP